MLGTASTRMTILSNGNVGINNTSPSFPLDVSGNIRATVFYGNAINTSNTITTYTNTVLTSSGGREIDMIEGKNMDITSAVSN